MIRLVRYLKPYLSMILLTIVLLFVQANADLALPDSRADAFGKRVDVTRLQALLPEHRFRLP